MEFNLADLFECVADAVPERDALVCGSRRLTYSELDQRSTKLAHGFTSLLGIGRGEHVGLHLYNCVEFVESMLACYKLRAVPVNINYRYVGDELAHVLANADAVAVVHDHEFAPLLAAIRKGLPRLRQLVDIETQYEQLLAASSSERDFEPRSASDHYVLYTGGTTGLPRGVVWRHEDIFFAVLGGGNAGGPPIQRPDEIARTVLTNRAQRVTPFLPPGHPGPEQFSALSLGPLMHASGQWMALSTLLGGGKVVLYADRHMNMVSVLELVERERVTMLSLVGDANARPLVDELRAHPGRYDTSSLLLLGSGGAILSGDVKDALMAELPSVLAISEAIGSSEAPIQGIAVVTRDQGPSTTLQFANRGASVVVDEQLKPITPGSGRVGRLATRGRLPVGYYNDPEKTAATFVEIDGDRWSLPGDMATVDADGTIRVLGRGALCINTGGEKVYPDEVEAALKTHTKVADAVVVGATDPRWGQRVVAVVAPRDRTNTPSLDDVQAHCRQHLAGYKVPRELVVVDEVVRGPAGKPDYGWAARVVAGGGDSDGAS